MSLRSRQKATIYYREVMWDHFASLAFVVVDCVEGLCETLVCGNAHDGRTVMRLLLCGGRRVSVSLMRALTNMFLLC